MSKVWSGMIVISIVVAFLSGDPGQITSQVMEQSTNAMENMIDLIGMLCFWNGIFNIFEHTNAINKVSKAVENTIAKLFNKNQLNDSAVKYMSLNITTNVLGIGNAATVHGIKAMEKLQEENFDKDNPSDNMTLFVLINTASLQLIPTSMIAMRSIYNSSDPAAIVVPVWIVTICALVAGIVSIKILNKWVK